MRAIGAKQEGLSTANREHAGKEIEFISTLGQLPAFQWFMAEFIDKPYIEASAKMKAAYDPVEHARYKALAEVKGGIIKRELVHRESIDPRDSRIIYLRKKLDEV